MGPIAGDYLREMYAYAQHSLKADQWVLEFASRNITRYIPSQAHITRG